MSFQPGGVPTGPGPAGVEKDGRDFKAKGPRGPRVNNRIRVPQVRVIGAGGEQIGIMDTPEALRMAESQGLDLVEVADAARPPVCRIMNYGKFKYEKKKMGQESRKKSHVMQIKELRMGAKIHEHDLAFKLGKARDFLERGDKVIITMMFRGREMAHTDLGRATMERITKELAPLAKVEQSPRMENRRMSMVLNPIRR